MARPLALVAVLAALLLGLWFAFREPDPAPAPVDHPGGNQAPARATAADGASDPEPLGRTEAELPSPDNDEQPDAPTFVVHGRCVDGQGAPLANVQVRLRTEADRRARDAEWDETRAADATTADDGTFRCERTYDDWVDTLAVRLHTDGRCARVGRWPQPRRGTEVDLGDVVMLRSIDVHGVVVDRQGVAVEGVSMMFVYIALTGAQQTESQSMLRATSDAAGRFTFPAPAHPGEWYIGAEDTGALVEPRSVKLSDETGYELRVVVERPDPKFDIRGTVTDPAGNAIPGLRLSVQGEGFIGRGRSDAAGAFTIRRAGPIPDNGKSGTALSVQDPNARYDRVQPELGERIDWGTSDLRVVMQPRAGQNVRVVDAAGEPVEQYTLFVLRGDERKVPLRGKTMRGHHPDGRCRLPDLRAGPHAALVVPRGAGRCASPPVPFEVQSGVDAAELVVTTPEPARTRIEVRDQRGTAVAGSQVELLLSLGTAPPSATSPAVDLRDLERGRGSPEHIVFDRAHTGADGIAELVVPRGARYAFHLRVVGLAHITKVQPMEVTAPDASITVDVRRAAVLRGKLVPPEAFAVLREHSRGGDEPMAVLAKPEEGTEQPPAVVDEHGNFLIGGLEAGTYQLTLRYWLRTSEVRFGSVKLRVEPVTLAAGEQRELQLAVDDLLPGRVTGRIVAGGKPLADVHCFLRRTGPGSIVTLRIATDSDGRFEGLVPAGDYGFAMTYPAQPGPGWMHMVLPDSWQLAPGAHREVALDVPLRRARLQVLRGDQPVEGARLRVLCKGYSLPGGLKTDAQGRVEVFPAPLDAFDLDVTIDDDKQRLGPFDLPLGATEGDVVVRLPE